jgi:hypothetical protein
LPPARSARSKIKLRYSYGIEKTVILDHRS